MKACVDVDYRDPNALAACCLFDDWPDADSRRDVTAWITGVEPYVPGQFYKRELPCLLAVLNLLDEPLELIVVDSYVWLQDENHPGMGAHLYRALGGRVPVVGVAKTRYLSARDAREVVRGPGHRPLYVSAVGLAVDDAANQVRTMHGESRLPTLLRKVDHLARQTLSPIRISEPSPEPRSS